MTAGAADAMPGRPRRGPGMIPRWIAPDNFIDHNDI
jgi:hypothetical protein